MTPTQIEQAVAAQQRAINILSGMSGYDRTAGALLGPDALRALLAPPSVLGMPEGLPNFMAFNLKGKGYHRGIHDITEDCKEECLTFELHAEGSRDRLRELEALAKRVAGISCENMKRNIKTRTLTICGECIRCRARAISKEKP